jgi:hypothetical protein
MGKPPALIAAREKVHRYRRAFHGAIAAGLARVRVLPLPPQSKGKLFPRR